MPIKVAVYGTLKIGGALHGNMKSINAVFNEKKVIPGFKMYDLGPFPAVVKDDVSEISVEIYNINEEGLARLDRVEGYPNFYNRMQLEDGSWIYFMDKSKVSSDWTIIKDGNWKKLKN